MLTSLIFAKMHAHFMCFPLIGIRILDDAPWNAALHWEPGSAGDQPRVIRMPSRHPDMSYSLRDAMSFVVMRQPAGVRPTISQAARADWPDWAVNKPCRLPPRA